MEPIQPMIELILSQAEEPGECVVCERTSCTIRCESCHPAHYLCRECIDAHRDDFNQVVG